MRIVFIGSGNIAHFFATRLKAGGHDLVQVYSRIKDHAAALASLCHIPSVTTNLDEITADADVYILAIKDDALAGVAARLHFPGKTVIHCAGAVPLQPITGVSEHCAVIWSLYSVRKNNLPEGRQVPLILEGNTERALEVAQSLAVNISDTLLETDFLQRQMLHLNAVLVNNFTNHLLTIAQKLGEEHNLPFDILQPIIRQTLEQVQRVMPAQSQTGPALRRDEETIQKHLALLQAHPAWQKVYAALSESIQQTIPVTA